MKKNCAYRMHYRGRTMKVVGVDEEEIGAVTTPLDRCQK